MIAAIIVTPYHITAMGTVYGGGRRPSIDKLWCCCCHVVTPNTMTPRSITTSIDTTEHISIASTFNLIATARSSLYRQSSDTETAVLAGNDRRRPPQLRRLRVP